MLKFAAALGSFAAFVLQLMAFIEGVNVRDGTLLTPKFSLL